MKKIAILVGFLFFALSPNLSSAEALYFDCGKEGKWKYEKGFFGGKVYYEEKDIEWVFNKDTIIQEDKIVIGGWSWSNNDENCKPKCYNTRIISLLPMKVNKNTFVNYKKFYTKDCKRDDNKKGECRDFKAGQEVTKRQCMLQKPLKP